MYLAYINQKKSGVVPLISNKLDLEKENYQRQSDTLHNDKMVNLPRRHNSPRVYIPNKRTEKYIKQNLI